MSRHSSGRFSRPRIYGGALLTSVTSGEILEGEILEAPGAPAALAAPTAHAAAVSSAPATIASTGDESEEQDSWPEDAQPCVLLVMHNTMERLLMKRLCQAEGCGVHTSDTGLKALQMMAANKGKYALCLMDTVLSDVGPSSLCSQMLELELGGACCGLINQ